MAVQQRQIADSDSAILGKVAVTVRSLFPSAEVWLFGSFARSEEEEESDYDILVATDSFLSSNDKDAVRRALFDIELECGRVISAVFESKAALEMPLYKSMPFYREVVRDAIPL